MDLLSAKGTIYSIPPSLGRRPLGYFIIWPFPFNLPNPIPIEQVLIDDIAIAKGDIYLPVHGLNNTKLLYAFGRNFGSAEITGTLLLGNLSIGIMEKAITVWFNMHRLSTSKKTVTLISGVTANKCFLTDLSFGGTNAEFNTRTFTMRGVVIE